MRIVTGIDGGGSTTRAALVSTDGRVLGIGRAGPGNIHDIGREGVLANLGSALAEAWRRAGGTPAPTEAAFFGMASVVTGEEREVIRTIARELGVAPAARVGVDHDLRIALAGGLAGESGIVLIAGTGSSCYGRTGDGRSWKAGGWGSRLDDGGSSAYLGLQAMIAAVREYDGRGAATVMSSRVMEALDIHEMRQILGRVDAGGLTRQDIAALSRVVIGAASEGDGVAVEIIRRGVEELALLVETVARKLGWLEPTGTERVRVTVTGGLGQSGPVYREPLYEAIRRRVRGAKLIEPRLEPVGGAVMLAMDSLGESTDEGIVASLCKGGLASSTGGPEDRVVPRGRVSDA